MKRMLLIVALLALCSAVVGGCGGEPPQLTEQHMSSMSDAADLLTCQMVKIAQDKGSTEAAADYVADKVMASMDDPSTPPVQVELWAEGYTCDSWGKDWRIE
jgi:hypothetical protein